MAFYFPQIAQIFADKNGTLTIIYLRSSAQSAGNKKNYKFKRLAPIGSLKNNSEVFFLYNSLNDYCLLQFCTVPI
jgi:hypothetical protein